MFGLLSWVSAAAFAAEGGIDLDRYKPPSDHLGYFTAQSADTLGHLQLGVAARAVAEHVEDPPGPCVRAADRCPRAGAEIPNCPGCG